LVYEWEIFSDKKKGLWVQVNVRPTFADLEYEAVGGDWKISQLSTQQRMENPLFKTRQSFPEGGFLPCCAFHE
jgi:hypothetical protein